MDLLAFIKQPILSACSKLNNQYIIFNLLLMRRKANGYQLKANGSALNQTGSIDEQKANRNRIAYYNHDSRNGDFHKNGVTFIDNGYSTKSPYYRGTKTGVDGGRFTDTPYRNRTLDTTWSGELSILDQNGKLMYTLTYGFDTKGGQTQLQPLMLLKVPTTIHRKLFEKFTSRSLFTGRSL